MPDPTSSAVTVVTRTKDRALLLDRAVRSVMQQTHGNLRQVIVNDGGDPGAVDAVVAARRDEVQGRVQVVHRATSSGMEAATNAGLRADDAPFVAVLDDDDSWHPTFLERTVGALEDAGAMGVVTGTRAVYEDTDYGDIRFLESFDFDPLADIRPAEATWPPAPPNSLFRLLSGNQFPPCSFVYRRAALDEVGVYDERLPVLGDWDFNIRFLLRYEILHIAEPLAYYHHRIGESGRDGNSVSRADDLHDQVRSQLLDRYLRQDLERGQVGVGVLTNLLHQLRAERADDLAARARLSGRLDALEQMLEARSPEPGAAGPGGAAAPEGDRTGATPVTGAEPDGRSAGGRTRRKRWGGPPAGGRPA